MRQRWSPLSVSAAVSDLKLSIDLIPPRTGLHIKTDAVIQLLGDGYILCVCVCVQAHGCSPGSGYYGEKKYKIQSYVLSADSHTNCNIPQKSSSAPANAHWPSLLMLTSFNLEEEPGDSVPNP